MLSSPTPKHWGTGGIHRNSTFLKTQHKEITKLFTELVQGKALDILAGPFRALRNRQVLNALLAEGKRVFDLILKGDEGQIPRFGEVLDCLASRKDPEVEECLLGCFAKSNVLAKVKAKTIVITGKNSMFTGADLLERLTVLLYQIGSPNTIAAILEKRESLPTAVFPQVLRSALRTWSADKVYQEFSPLLGQTKGAGKEKFTELKRFIAATQWDQSWRFDPAISPDFQAKHLEEVELLKQVKWDERWLEAAIKANETVIVYTLARPDHRSALKYLLSQSETEQPAEPHLLMRALIHCRHPQSADVLLKLIAKKTKSAKYFDYEMQLLFENAQHLTAADLPKLDAFAAKLDEKFIDKYLEALAPLRPTLQSN